MEVLFPGMSRVARRFAVDFVELPERQETDVAGACVTAYAVQHPSGAPAYALRVACEGKIVTYSGDTAWTEALVDAAQDADLFICEAYTFEKAIPHHLAYTTLRAHRGQLTCRRLLLTHTSADLLARRAEVADEIAEDGLLVEL
jgi:ribonuclease BN (tRNA processing enzyme)